MKQLTKSLDALRILSDSGAKGDNVAEGIKGGATSADAALHVAIRHRHLGIVHVLLQTRANPGGVEVTTAKGRENRRTELFSSAKGGWIDSVRVCCRLRPDPVRFLRKRIEDKNRSGLHYMTLTLMVVLKLRVHCILP